MAELTNKLYIPSLPDNRDLENKESLEDLLVWLDKEHIEIASTISLNYEGYEVTHVAPDKLRVGTIKYADGTNWNPGSGEGLYIYKSGGWTFIA